MKKKDQNNEFFHFLRGSFLKTKLVISQIKHWLPNQKWMKIFVWVTQQDFLSDSQLLLSVILLLISTWTISLLSRLPTAYHDFKRVFLPTGPG